MKSARACLGFASVLGLYAGFSGVLISLQYFLLKALLYASFLVLNAARGPARLYRIDHTGYDALGFAFLTVTNTVLQYYLASLLAHDLRGWAGSGRFRGAKLAGLLGILFFSCALSAAVFIRLSAGSNFSSYALAAIPLALSYLLGALPGLLQKEQENPFRGSVIRIFRPD